VVVWSGILGWAVRGLTELFLTNYIVLWG
jgi:hypothetical protein